MHWAAATCALALLGCNGHEARPASETVVLTRTAEQAARKSNEITHAGEPVAPHPSTQEKIMENGAQSPAGETHPGEILHEDKIDGRTWTRAAGEVPLTIAWVEVNGTWKPVVRIEITGTADQRRITKFGADGQMLETTIQAPPPRRAATPVPAPTPTWTPDKRQ